MKKRVKNTYTIEVDDFRDIMLVVCPVCSGKAYAQTVRRHNERISWDAIRLTCTHCGFGKVYDTSRLHVALWLSTPCAGHWLWALNAEHLDFLQRHVEAFLRERNAVPNKNSSLGSRLPRWMTAAKNRNNVLKCIEKLRQKI